MSRDGGIRAVMIGLDLNNCTRYSVNQKLKQSNLTIVDIIFDDSCNKISILVNRDNESTCIWKEYINQPMAIEYFV